MSPVSLHTLFVSSDATRAHREIQKLEGDIHKNVLTPSLLFRVRRGAGMGGPSRGCADCSSV